MVCWIEYIHMHGLWTRDVTIPIRKTEWMQRWGLGEEKRIDRFGTNRNTVASFNSFQWCRCRDVWLWASFRLSALGNSFNINFISYKGSNPYPIFFLCQGCSCINQPPLLETFAINPINQQTKNANFALLAPANPADSEPWPPSIITEKWIEIPTSGLT